MKMTAMAIDKYGQKIMESKQVEVPKVKKGQVLVKIHAASINPVDFKIRDGALKLLLSYKFPLILGNDFAGEVVKVGRGVKEYQVGDKVYGRTNKDKIGTFAEYIAVEEDVIAPMPSNLNYVEAASIPLVGLTSYQALYEELALLANQKILIQAGSGGVGTFAIQLAKIIGAHVATTVSDKGVDLVTSLGADEVINYKETNFKDVLSDYDAVFDTLGGKQLEDSFSILKPGGKVVSISGLPTEVTAQRLGLGRAKQLLFKLVSRKLKKQAKQYDATYEFLFMRPSGEQLATITQHIETGKIKPVIDRVFKFEDTQKALDYSESGRAKGKIIIEM